MTITSATRAINHEGDGSSTEWDFPFRVYDEGHVRVEVFTKGAAYGDEVVSSAFSLTLNAGDSLAGYSGGTVTYPLSGDPLPPGWTLRISVVVPTTQTGISLSNTSGFNPKAVERAFDLVHQLIRQVAGGVGATGLVKTPPLLGGLSLPPPLSNAPIGWNAAADALATMADSSSVAYIAPVIRRLSGTGTATEFTGLDLPFTPNSLYSFVFVDGALVDPDNYTLTATTITFDTAPASGTDNILIRAGAGIEASPTNVTPNGLLDAGAITDFLGKFLVFENVADLEGTNFSAPTGTRVFVTAYASAGDFGAAFYRKVAAEPSHPGKAQSADGSWWELDEAFPLPEMFGAVGDGVVDDINALDAVLAYAAAAGAIIKMRPGAIYSISTPWVNENYDDVLVDGGWSGGEFNQGDQITNCPTIRASSTFTGDAVLQWGKAGEAPAILNAGLHGFAVSGNGQTDVSGIEVRAVSKVDMSRMRVTDCDGYGVDIRGVFYSSFERCSFRFNRKNFFQGYDGTRKCDHTEFVKCIFNNGIEENLYITGPDATGIANQHGPVSLHQCLLEVPGDDPHPAPLAMLSNIIHLRISDSTFSQAGNTTEPCILVGPSAGWDGQIYAMHVEGTRFNHGGSVGSGGAVVKFNTHAGRFADEEGYVYLDFSTSRAINGSAFIDASGLEFFSRVEARGPMALDDAVINQTDKVVYWTDVREELKKRDAGGYAWMTWGQNLTTPIPITTSGTFVKVPGTTTLTEATDHFQQPSINRIQYRRYTDQAVEVHVDITISQSSGSDREAALRLLFRDASDSSESTLAVSEQRATLVNGVKTSISLNAVVTMEQFDYIEVHVANEDSSDNLTLHGGAVLVRTLGFGFG